MMLVLLVAVSSFAAGSYSASSSVATDSLVEVGGCLGQLGMVKAGCGSGPTGCIGDYVRYGAGTFDGCIPSGASGFCKSVIEMVRSDCE